MRTRVALRSMVAAGALCCSLLGSAALLAGSATAQAGGEECAPTVEPGPSVPAPGTPCWVDQTPYPFGVDGEPVDTTLHGHGCATRPAVEQPPTSGFFGGYDPFCYLEASSFAFRHPKRGLAAMRATPASQFSVWQFNGVRWSPDPTFLGRGSCPGDTVLWAGKRDYWLVGPKASGNQPATRDWQALCRFDGEEFAWQPIPVPAETLAHVPKDPITGVRERGAITTGSCAAWNDCWFFGDFGVTMHWDGSALTDASPDPFAELWLQTSFAGAAAATSARGAVGIAVGSTGRSGDGQQVPGRTPGTAPPQVFASSGGRFGPFTPFGFAPMTLPLPGDPARTDLAGVGLDARERGWIAGNPVVTQPTDALMSSLGPRGREARAPAPAPIEPFTLDASEPACTPPQRSFEFEFDLRPAGYLWSSLAVNAETGDALAGGATRPDAAGATRNGDGPQEPVLVGVSCDGAVETTRFRDRDPTAPDGAPLVPANRGIGLAIGEGSVPFGTGYAGAVATTARNDGWASTARGVLQPAPPNAQSVWQRPHLYRLSDSTPPLAPAPDDTEPARGNLTVEPPIIIVDPPQQEEEAAGVDEVVQERPAPPRTTPARKAAVYGITFSKPRRIGRDRYVIYVSFRVRRAVTIGVQALRGKGKRKVVVSTSGLKRLKPGRRRLALRIERKRWPTGGIRFYSPTGAASAAAAASPAPARESQR